MSNRSPVPQGIIILAFLGAMLGFSPGLKAQGGDATVALPVPPAQILGPNPFVTVTPAAPPALTAQPTPPAQNPKDDRIFFALPNYLTVEQSSYLPPLSTGLKFKAVAEGCFDPMEAIFIAIQAGIDQADHVNPTYRYGALGYTKRYATAYADVVIGNFGTGAIFPALLHQDPRYYQMGKGNFFHRFGYAAERIVVTRSDSGTKEFNFSEFLGNGMAAAASNAYHPGPHTVVGSADVMATQIVLDTIGYELKEFWPDIHHLLHHAAHKG